MKQRAARLRPRRHLPQLARLGHGLWCTSVASRVTVWRGFAFFLLDEKHDCSPVDVPDEFQWQRDRLPRKERPK